MNMLKRCIGYLKQNGIRYSHSVHPPAFTAREAASADRMPAHAMMKTVVYSGDNGYGMLVLPADCAADFDEVHRLLGLTEIRLATEAELAALFPEWEVGAMPPSEICSTCPCCSMRVWRARSSAVLQRELIGTCYMSAARIFTHS